MGRLAVGLALVVALACGDDAMLDVGASDGGADTSFDSGFDVGPSDAGMDASEDAASDAATDAPVDAPIDAPVDAPVDTPVDAPLDAPSDVPMDASTSACSVSTNRRLTPDPTSSNAARLVWNGTGYGVAWSASGDVFFQRLDADGVPIATPTTISNDAAESEGLSLAWTGSEYGITWYDQRDGNYEIYFARANASGAKIGDDVRVTNDAGRSWGAELVSNGSGYGVAWWENRGSEGDRVYFARLDSAGAKIGGDVMVTTTGDLSGSPSLAWNGSGYGVAWGDRRSGSEIWFALLDASGTRMGAEIRVTDATGNSGLPSLVWNGTEYGLGWEDDRSGTQELWFTRLDASGTEIGDDLYVADRLFSPWNMVWDGTGWAAAWSDARTGVSENLEVYFVRLDATGTAIESDVRVTTADGQSRAPSLVFNGTHYGVVWTDVRDAEWAVYFSELCR